MTMVFSSIFSDRLIVMLSDSSIRKDFSDHVEYVVERKFIAYPGVGCLTTWGRRGGNNIEHFLGEKNISPKSHSVEELAELTWSYLKEEFRPHEYDDPEEIGYHVGGFDRQGKPRLFHYFWGCNRPRTSPSELPDYHRYDHSGWQFLYNGRNDLANVVVNSLIEELRAGDNTRYDVTTPVGRVQFCDFVGRFASELTPQVGPPFVMNLIIPDNIITQIVNRSLSPIQIDDTTLRLLETIR